MSQLDRDYAIKLAERERATKAMQKKFERTFPTKKKGFQIDLPFPQSPLGVIATSFGLGLVIFLCIWLALT